MSEDPRDALCKDPRVLQDALRGNIGTPQGWDRQVEPLIAGTYNGIVSRAQEQGLRTTPEVDQLAIPPSYRDLLTTIEVHLHFLECPEPQFRAVEEGLFDDY